MSRQRAFLQFTRLRFAWHRLAVVVGPVAMDITRTPGRGRYSHSAAR